MATPLVAVPSPNLVTNLNGAPEAPRDILDRLRRVDPALSMRWMPDLDRSSWALTWEWPLSDPRWSRVQSGDISRESAYDILGYLPVDCPAEQAGGYVEKHLKQYPKEDIRKLYQKVQHWNTVEVPAQQTQQVIADTMDDVARQRRRKQGRRIVVG